VDEAVLAQRRAGVDLALIGRKVVFALIERAAQHAGVQAVILIFEHDVDHAGDGVGAVLRRGAVFQHLDVSDGAGRDHIQIDRVHAAGVVAAVGDQRAVVAALTVHQNKGIGRPHAAVVDRPHDGIDAGLRLAEIDRGQQLGQRLRQIGPAGVGDLVRLNHVDRRRALGHGARLAAPHAGDNDGADACILGIRGRLRRRRRRGGG